MRNTIIHGDCLEVMPTLPAGSVDMILADLPYGTTACAWDSLIPLEPLWEQYKRLIKPYGAVVLTGSQPFSSLLIMSNLEWFKYEWVWEKTRPTGHIHAKNKPMKSHENVLVFSRGTTVHASQSVKRMPYNPQGLAEVNRYSYRPSRGVSGSDVVASLRPSHKQTVFQPFEGYPKSVLKIASEHNVGALHSTQKPVALFEYLIRTYTEPGDVVLDNVAGSGTTAIACLNTGRDYVCIEKNLHYVEVAQKRVQECVTRLEASSGTAYH